MRLLGLIFLLSIISSAARADCSLSATAMCNGINCANEPRPEGAIIYNEDFKVHAGCVNGVWKTIGANGKNECTGTEVNPFVGDTCLDGSIYAGRTPDGNALMYTTPADAGLFTWNDGTANFLDTAMVNCISPSPGTAATCQTGEANTAFLVGATSEPDYPFAAAEYCNGLSAHGQSDWYLPAQDELNVMYTNRVAIGGFDVSGSFPAGYYWSSSERSNGLARGQRFSDGSQLNFTKNGGLSVRCVRR